MCTLKADTQKQETKKQRLAKEGRCPDCGEFSYPYYRCRECTMLANIRRVTRKFEKLGWIDVERDPNDKRVKIFKWNNSAPVDRKHRQYSPETIAKLSLPRLNGKPLTDEVLNDCIIKVLEVNQMPLTKKEIKRGVKSMKTIGKVVPEVDQLLAEYALIQAKQSKLSKSHRDAVQYRVNFLIKRGVINAAQISNFEKLNANS